jgi:hypothetical protein
MVLEIVRSSGRGSSEDRLTEQLLVDRREQPTHPRAVAALLLGTGSAQHLPSLRGRPDRLAAAAGVGHDVGSIRTGEGR